jgi:hypothetical protein
MGASPANRKKIIFHRLADLLLGGGNPFHFAFPCGAPFFETANDDEKPERASLAGKLSLSSSSALPSQIATSFPPGERVRMRPGGPMTVVDGIRGIKLIAIGQAWMACRYQNFLPAAVLQKY